MTTPPQLFITTNRLASEIEDIYGNCIRYSYSELLKLNWFEKCIKG